MSARRIARELAVILLPQLPKEKSKLEKIDVDQLASRAVQMLTDYAKQCLSEANSFINRSQQLIFDQETNHPVNADELEDLRPVPVTTGDLKKHLGEMERALQLASEALDIPQMAVETGKTDFLFRLVSTYSEHKAEIDQFIGRAKAKWRIDRMVSIDRDIIRLACAEAFYMKDIPINVCISEAVELSHRFADEKAAKFINGVLSDLADEARHFRNTGTFSDYPQSDPVSQSHV